MSPTSPLAVFALAFASLVASPAAAQKPQPAPQAGAAMDAAFGVQKSAFLALPLETRTAVQDALVWLGLYNGTSDGEFGKRTRDAIVGWQTSQRQAADGILSPTQTEALLAAARKARAAAGFETITDPRTGARVGAPKKFTSGTGGATLNLLSSADGDLAGLYARLSADGPARKVAYKAMKPGAFFVVSGRQGEAKFYARYERNETAEPPIRGFIFSYPAARAAPFDRIAIAVANSFEAFPRKPDPAKSAAQPQSSQASAANAQPRATALVLARGQALSALKTGDCPTPSINGAPAKIARRDDASGLVTLTGDFGWERRSPHLAPPSTDLIVLSRSGPEVAATSAALSGDAARPAIVAGLDRSASGAPVFNRQGELAGIVAPIDDDPKRVARVALIARHAIIGVDALRSFVAPNEMTGDPAPAPKSAGAIAADEKDAVVAVYCGT